MMKLAWAPCRISTAVTKLDADKSGTYFCAGTFVIHPRERSMTSSEPSHCVLGVPEDCVTNGHVGGIPVACSQTVTSNCVPSPDDGDGVVVWETGRSCW